MTKMTWRLLGEEGLRLDDSLLSHVSGHASVGVLALCPFDWTVGAEAPTAKNVITRRTARGNVACAATILNKH